jgi:AhpD family alkylhydroperoxidase
MFVSGIITPPAGSGCTAFSSQAPPLYHSRIAHRAGAGRKTDGPRVRLVFDDIKRTRDVADVNNFWKYLANDETLLERTWESMKQVMPAGALSPLVKELVYVAVSVTNGCGYCIASHSASARKAGMTDAMFGELMAVVGMANETNRLANGYRVPIDEALSS